MAIEVFNRYESKYLIDTKLYYLLQEKLLAYMEMDINNQQQEFYTIRNIYYDTADHYLIRKSLQKPKYKEKLRLRCYGPINDGEKAYLEIKKKFCGLVNKRRTELKLEEAYDFVSTLEKPESQEYMNQQVLNEIQYFLRRYELEPKLYLAYDRKALLSTDNHDLRITFDTNIRARRSDLRMESGDYAEELFHQDLWLMEIKTINNFPVWLSRLLSQYKIYSTSFSKYGYFYTSMLTRQQKMKGDTYIC